MERGSNKKNETALKKGKRKLNRDGNKEGKKAQGSKDYSKNI